MTATLFPTDIFSSQIQDILNLLIQASSKEGTPVKLFSSGDGWAVFSVDIKAYDSKEVRASYDVKIIAGQAIEVKDLAILELAFRRFLSEHGWTVAPNFASIKSTQSHWLPNYLPEQPGTKVKVAATLSQDPKLFELGQEFRSYALQRLLHLYHMVCTYYAHKARFEDA